MMFLYAVKERCRIAIVGIENITELDIFSMNEKMVEHREERGRGT